MTLFFAFLRFAHLISIDFFDDLFGVLNELVVADVSYYLRERHLKIMPYCVTCGVY